VASSPSALATGGARTRRLCCSIGLLAAAVTLTAAPARASTMYLVEGGGWGHGVGLGQWGAEGYALHGWGYQQILAHYYPGTTLSAARTTTVRVLVADGESQVAVGSASPFLLVDGRGRKVHVRPRTLRFSTRLRYGHRRLVAPVEVVPGASALSLDGKGYRGSLTLLARGGAFTVVNTVPLELYVRGVVSSEMPQHWAAAALEAQAVIARTYALAELRSRPDYDLVASSNDQVYGGIDAERGPSNLAVGATAGRVLTYGGRVITAYYSSSTGGRTEAVENGFPGHVPEPYLVSVSDPYDTLSPEHHWLVPLSSDELAAKLRFPVEDVRVEHDSSGRALNVTLVGRRGSRVLAGRDVREALGLRSTNFSVRVLSLTPPSASADFGLPVSLTGFVRGVGGVSLQQRTGGSDWRLAARIRAAPDGRFVVQVRPQATSEYRLAVDEQAGPSVEVQVAPRITVEANDGGVTGKVRPSVPLRIERAVNGGWRLVAHVPVGPSGYFQRSLKRGRYRVTASPSSLLTSAASSPLVVPR
jgi:SpoIID/LytB domain protein